MEKSPKHLKWPLPAGGLQRGCRWQQCWCGQKRRWQRRRWWGRGGCLLECSAGWVRGQGLPTQALEVLSGRAPQASCVRPHATELPYVPQLYFPTQALQLRAPQLLSSSCVGPHAAQLLCAGPHASLLLCGPQRPELQLEAGGKLLWRWSRGGGGQRGRRQMRLCWMAQGGWSLGRCGVFDCCLLPAHSLLPLKGPLPGALNACSEHKRTCGDSRWRHISAANKALTCCLTLWVQGSGWKHAVGLVRPAFCEISARLKKKENEGFDIQNTNNKGWSQRQVLIK